MLNNRFSFGYNQLHPETDRTNEHLFCHSEDNGFGKIPIPVKAIAAPIPYSNQQINTKSNQHHSLRKAFTGFAIAARTV
jgi:hypothetical protein